jgi:CheY-like chemotaxis protein
MSASMIKILVIEDERDLRLYIVNLLRGHGFDPLTAASPDDALRVARCEKPFLVVLDAMLPSDGAQQIYNGIKGDPALGHVPVVMLSSLTRRSLRAGLPQSGSTAQARRLPGPDAFLPNPPEAEEFIAVVRQLTDTRRHAGEKERV